MKFREQTGNALSRAHTPEDKARVRRAFIEAGRQLFSDPEHGDVSLRQIAAKAGYSPGTIYQYFHDHRELMFAVREQDMNAATDLFEHASLGERNPRLRLRKLFLTSVRYWLKYPSHFDLLFSGPGRRAAATRPSNGTAFGKSASVKRSLKLYRDAVDTFLQSLPKRPLATVLATDILIATTHGIIAFTRVTPTLAWSSTASMAEHAIDALLDQWTRQGQA